MQKPPRIICVILGGGRGTRLYPLTRVRAKPAVPLAGKYRLADVPISNCLNSGLNKIYLLTQFNTVSLHRHIQESYQFDSFGGGFVRILSAQQTEEGDDWYQGTADAVRQNLMHFGQYEPDDLFLILSGDQLYSMDLQKMLKHHQDCGADVTVAGNIFHKSLASGFGLMQLNEDLRVLDFVEKPQDPQQIDALQASESMQLRSGCQSPKPNSCLVSMGIYVFKASVLLNALDGPGHDFGKEIIPSLVKDHKIYSYIFDGYWEDIGTVKAYFDASLRLTDTLPPFNFFDPNNPVYTNLRYLPASKLNQCCLQEVMLSEGCILSQANLSRCVMGLRCVVRDHSTLKNVIMMGAESYETPEHLQANTEAGRPHIGIGQNCYIENAILDKNVRIGNNVRLSPEGKSECYLKDDILVRDGLIIVNKNGVIPDNTVF